MEDGDIMGTRYFFILQILLDDTVLIWWIYENWMAFKNYLYYSSQV